MSSSQQLNNSADLTLIAMDDMSVNSPTLLTEPLPIPSHRKSTTTTTTSFNLGLQ
jgi:hypothetical protein